MCCLKSTWQEPLKTDKGISRRKFISLGLITAASGIMPYNAIAAVFELLHYDY